MKNVRFVGLDVHAETIAVAAGVAHGKGEPSLRLCDRPIAARPAPLVRGSSRRNHDHDGGPCARSTNIRVINRRHALPRLLFTCAWTESKPRSLDLAGT